MQGYCWAGSWDRDDVHQGEFERGAEHGALHIHHLRRKPSPPVMARLLMDVMVCARSHERVFSKADLDARLGCIRDGRVEADSPVMGSQRSPECLHLRGGARCRDGEANASVLIFAKTRRPRLPKAVRSPFLLPSVLCVNLFS